MLARARTVDRLRHTRADLAALEAETQAAFDLAASTERSKAAFEAEMYNDWLTLRLRAAANALRTAQYKRKINRPWMVFAAALELGRTIQS